MRPIPQFFFDTADTDLIKMWWSKLSAEFHGGEVAGVTTNPSALQKAGVTTMKDLGRKLWDLAEVMDSITTMSEIYVQLPNDNMCDADIFEFARFLKKTRESMPFSASIGMKIPPYKRILKLSDRLSREVPLNVTGIADCSTALQALSHKVRYASIIPGRMEEKGLDAKSHVSYIQSRDRDINRPNDLITGSMRTLEGLEWVIGMGTVPTIGGRVFDQIVVNKYEVEKFRAMWDKPMPLIQFNQSPAVLHEMTELSRDFFVQMNACGKDIHEDFQKVIIL